MANAYLALVSPVADAGVAHFLDTASAYTSGTLQSWRANGAEKASVDFEGSFAGKNSTLSGILSVDDTTDSTSTTSGSIHTDGGVGIALDLFVGDDLTLVSDAAVLNFGVNSDVSLTHVHDTGLLLNGTMQLQFNDSTQYINAPSNAILDINATDEIELNATAIDLNGTLDVSGTLTLAGNADFNGDLDVDGTTNLDVVDIDGAVDMAGALAVTGNFTVAGTGPNSIGVAADGAYRLNLAGSFTSDGTDSIAIGTFHGGIVTGAGGDISYMAGMFLDTQLITQTATESIGVISQLRIAEPNIGDNLTGDIGIAASVYIHATPSEGLVNAALYVKAGNIIHAAMATSDPSVAGALWNDSGTVKISSG